MPRANRHFLPGLVWHITHRCHRREFLLKFARDRLDCLRWLFQARKRLGLCVLNYIITSNHVHLLFLDRAEGVTSHGMLTGSRANGATVQPQKGTSRRILGRPLSRNGD